MLHGRNSSQGKEGKSWIKPRFQQGAKDHRPPNIYPITMLRPKSAKSSKLITQVITPSLFNEMQTDLIDERCSLMQMRTLMQVPKISVFLSSTSASIIGWWRHTLGMTDMASVSGKTSQTSHWQSSLATEELHCPGN